MGLKLAGFLLFFTTISAKSQFVDSFSGPDLRTNPPWIFTPGDFEISEGRLRAVNNNGGSVVYGISSAYNFKNSDYFTFDFELNANPSSSNYIDVFIGCDTLADLAENGYFIRIGDTKDEISFYKIKNKIRTQLISGIEGELNKTQNIYRVILYRNQASQWQLGYIIKNGTKITWLGKCVDSTFLNSKYVGIRIVQSGTGIIGKQYFDNVFFGNKPLDTVGPEMIKANVILPNQIEVSFNEYVEKVSNTDFLLNQKEIPYSAIKDSAIPFKVILNFTTPLEKNRRYELSNSETEDSSGNKSKKKGVFCIAHYYDTAFFNEIIFTEIMANPVPPSGNLPDAEYVEIKNTGPRFLTLKGCKFSDGTSSITLPDSVLKPYSYAIITKNSGVQWPLNSQQIIKTNTFPTLNNSSDKLSLISQNSRLISWVNYTDKWHTDGLKRKGGWSLELRDTGLNCIEENNWTSNINNGGTPGFNNSVAAALKLIPSFEVLRIYAVSETVLRVFFTQNSDSIFTVPSMFQIVENGEIPYKILNFDRTSRAVEIAFSKPLKSNTLYHLKISNVASCYGSVLKTLQIPFGLGIKTIKPGELIINELLFNPVQDDPDYVELFNTGDNFIELQDVLLANINNGVADKTIAVTSGGYTINPGAHVVITTNPASIQNRYPVHNKNNFITVSSLPTFPNDKGHVAIYSRNGILLDQLEYSEKMHSPVLANPDGVSLEKINPIAPSNVIQYWTSASQNSGFGTPGMPNSQLSENKKTTTFELQNKWFSPDNDGFNDLLLLNYELELPGYLFSATVFNESGFLIKHIFRNYILGTNGIISWDGATDQGVLNPGNYVIKVEAYHPSGNVIQRKFTFSVLKS